MLSHDFFESISNVVEFHEYDYDIYIQFVKYFYRMKMNLNGENVMDISRFAHCYGRTNLF